MYIFAEILQLYFTKTQNKAQIQVIEDFSNQALVDFDQKYLAEFEQIT